MSSAPLRSAVLDVLARAGTWVPRTDLDRLTTCAPALDDVLADLVVEGLAEFQQFVGYRLAISPLARQALQKLKLQPQDTRSVQAQTIEKNGRSQVRLGVAERRADLGGQVVTYDMTLPVCDTPAAALAQAQAWLKFCTNGGLING